MNPQTPSPKPLPLKVLKFAVTGMIAAINLLFYMFLQGSIVNKLQENTTTLTIVWCVFLIGLLLLAKKIVGFTVTNNPSVPRTTFHGQLITAMVIFEMAAVTGFASVFIIDSDLYLISGSIFAVIGIWFFVPNE